METGSKQKREFIDVDLHDFHKYEHLQDRWMKEELDSPVFCHFTKHY